MSQMQLVHAFDMEGMVMAHHSGMTGMRHSIFCETPPKSSETQCAKEFIPDKLLAGNDPEKFSYATFMVLPMSFTLSEITIQEPAIPANPHGPPDAFFQKTKYTSLVGIIKNVN